MLKKIILLSLLLLTSCISVEVKEPNTPVPSNFVTATLPPTKSGYIPATPSVTPAITLTPTFAVTVNPNCRDSAVLIRDVTILYGTQMKPGEKFINTF